MPASKAPLAFLVSTILILMFPAAGTAEKLVIVGATVIDVSDFGRRDSDLIDSVVVIEEAYHRAGARYLAGSATDVWGTMPGISLHTELESLVRLGLTPREALAAATSNFNAVFPNWGLTGAVKAGWTANLLVLTGDPREDISNLRTIDTVVLAGRVVEGAVPLVEPQGD